MVQLGVDIGGTFTDLCAVDGENIATLKVPSTPHDPGNAVIQGLSQMRAKKLLPEGEVHLAHGTTVATNALIQRRGANCALLTTQGFRDVLELRRLVRPSGQLYNLQYEKKPALIPREMRHEVPERINYAGEVIVPLNEDEVRETICRLKSLGVESVAVSLLFSFLFPGHEQRIRSLFHEEAPDIQVYLSSDILPEIREYERTSAVAISAFVGPEVSGYLQRLQDQLGEEQRIERFYVMQSNGGLATPETVIQQPGTLLLSGPAAGVIAANEFAKRAGFRNLITFDMGGTSTDVSIIYKGTPATTTSREFDELPLAFPTLDIETIGAGGGSIAWVDAGGGFRVGPTSAGAVPGPAAYDQGGTDPTVTDANLTLGFLRSRGLLGSHRSLNEKNAWRALEENVAQPLKMSVPDAAAGIRRIVNENMANAVRLVTVDRGRDLRDFCLVAFGGAGPGHAAELARTLGIPWVVIPPYPGITSSLGLTMADIAHNFVLSRVQDLASAHPSELEDAFGLLVKKAHETLESDAMDAEHRLLERSMDLRYKGQGYSLTVSAPSDLTAPNALQTVIEAFERLHRGTYGFVTDQSIELVNLRMKAIGLLPKPPLPNEPVKHHRVQPDVTSSVRLGQHGEKTDVGIYRRARLTPGSVIEGPAIVEQNDSTVVVPPNTVATRDGVGNLIIGQGEWR